PCRLAQYRIVTPRRELRRLGRGRGSAPSDTCQPAGWHYSPFTLRTAVKAGRPAVSGSPEGCGDSIHDTAGRGWTMSALPGSLVVHPSLSQGGSVSYSAAGSGARVRRLAKPVRDGSPRGRRRRGVGEPRPVGLHVPESC